MLRRAAGRGAAAAGQWRRLRPVPRVVRSLSAASDAVPAQFRVAFKERLALSVEEQRLVTVPVPQYRKAVASYNARRRQMVLHGSIDDRLFVMQNPYLGGPQFRFPDGSRALDVARWFGNRRPVHLEIGSGYGDWLTEHAARNPAVNHIGVDVRWQRTLVAVARAATAEESAASGNVRFVYGRYQDLLHDYFMDGALTHITIRFPEPCPRQAEVKHRLILPHTARLLANKCMADARLTMVTDHKEWMDFSEAVLAESALWQRVPESAEAALPPPAAAAGGFGNVWLQRSRTLYAAVWRPVHIQASAVQ